MEPMGWGTALGALLSMILGVMGYLRYKRGKREKLGQAEADALNVSMDRADQLRDAPLKLRVDEQGKP